MKIVHLTTNYRGGAGIAAFRIHNSLLAEGVDSVFASYGLQPLIDIKGNSSVLITPHVTVLRRILRRIGKFFGNYGLFISTYHRIQYNVISSMVSFPVSDCDLMAIPEVKEADIIHLHAVHSILDYRKFFESLDKPIVWTLHDINPISGIFHLRIDEKTNDTVAGALNLKVSLYKSKYMNLVKKAAIVSPSKWLKDESISRGKFSKFPHFEIPNPVPDIFFTTEVKYQKSNVLKLAFVTSQVNDNNKGLNLLLKGLNEISDLNFELQIIGEGNVADFSGFKFQHIGHISNDAEMALIYCSCDALIIPSRDENLPNVMLEALSVGTPVISFNIGGMSQYIIDGFNGILAEHLNFSALAEAIYKFSRQRNHFDRYAIREFATKTFNKNLQAKKYIDVYRQLLNS